ncbi:MAG: aldolase [Phycisphaerae bacterium]|jgi:4-hydroxy-2-oxoheptanedioate aldolase
MTGHELRQALHAGRRVYGSALHNPLLWAAQGYTQLDFVFLDNEHVPLDRSQTMALCQAYRARGIAPLVRVPTGDPILACMALDAGAEGIISPYAEDPEGVRAMVGAVKYRPLKGEKLARFLRDGGGVEPATLAYLEERNRNNVLLINVESLPAIERLDALLAVPGLDAVLIGPHDLSISMNLPEQYEHPAFIEMAERIITRARAAGLGAGIHYWPSLEREKHYVGKGANLIVHSTDTIEAAKAINAALLELRRAFGDVPGRQTGESTVV